MDKDTVDFLLSDEGGELLESAGALEGSFLQRVSLLRKRYSPSVAGAALELLELRHRAAKKFTRADEMFFTREALEQSSGESISRYRAERFVEDSRVLDLACGIGGDTIGLAGRCFVTAVDSDPVRIAMAERNLQVYGLADRVKFVCADVETVALDADAAFLDPSRRFGGRRSTSFSQMSPSLEFLHKLLEAIPDCAVKLSPASDDDELESLGGEIEFISDSGECKEALVWFGRFKTASKRATILPGRTSIVMETVGEIAVVPPSNYLYEPDPSVIRAHLVEQLAAEMGASRIDEQIAYLTSDSLIKTPFARAYEILEVMPFNLKAISRRLRELNAGKVIVKKRGVPYDPREIEKRLKTLGTKEFILVLTRLAGKPWAMICHVVT